MIFLVFLQSYSALCDIYTWWLFYCSSLCHDRHALALLAVILPELDEVIDIRMPWFQVHRKGTLALASPLAANGLSGRLAFSKPLVGGGKA